MQLHCALAWWCAGWWMSYCVMRAWIVSDGLMADCCNNLITILTLK